jgi:threonine dehydrogenase-like Zn-dependent dehydrogenase/GT2 family glycosyltransferase
MPSVSVIIRARNEERYLPLLLNRLRRQNGEAAEIVVVDSGSTDRTLAIAEEGADKVVEIDPERFSFGRSLNLGCDAASGEILAVVSAHTYPSSNNWLQNLIAPFEDPEVGMVYGRQLAHERTRVWESRNFEHIYGPHSRVLIDEPFGNNANSAVRAELWGRKPFDESLTGLEDIEWARWAQRHGYVVWYAANAAIVHIHEESPAQVYRRFFREGAAHSELFPHARGYWRYSLLHGGANVLRDLHFGRLVGAPVRELLATPVYRASATLGFYRGGVERERRRAAAARSAVSRPARERRGVIISGPGQHKLVKLDNHRPDAGEVTIRVAYVGVCATDVEIAEGRQIYYESGRARFPIVPGHEYSGVVEAAGSEELEGWVGARVVAECAIGCGHCQECARKAPSRCPNRQETGVLSRDGAYATHVAVPARAIHRIPDGLPLLNAALVEPTAVVLKALRKARRLSGARTAVVGAGPIGHIAAQALRRLGADEVLVVDRDEERLRPFLGMAYSTATELSAGQLEGSETIVEATGAPDVVDAIARNSDPGAQVIVVGAPGEDGAPISTGADDGGREVVGSLASDSGDWPEAIQLLQSGEPDLAWLLEHIAPLERYAEAWDAVRSHERLKTVLRVDDEFPEQ